MTGPSAEERARLADKWLQQCGACDVGLPMGCVCATDDPRPVIASLLDALAAAEAKVARVEAAINERVTVALPAGRWLAEADREDPRRSYALINPDALLALMDEALAIRAALDPGTAEGSG